jgi:plasmid stabilization system protein ParE
LKKNFKIVSSPIAKKDAKRIAEYYEAKSSGLGKRFLKEVFKEQKQLRTDPKAFQVRYDEVRILFLKSFPYGLHYIIKENQVRIISIYGTSQDSEGWIDK